MSIDSLETFKEEYYKSVNQLITRMYKSIFAINTLFPEFNSFQTMNIFDKAYQLQILSQTFSQYNMDNLNEVEKLRLPKLFEFEK